METMRMPVQGMTCGNCARSVERKLSAIPGVGKVAVDLSGGAATIEYDPSQVQPEKFAEAVRDLGYQVPA